MILGKVDQDADRRIETRREIDLERRAFDDVHPARVRRLQRQDRRADIAAKLGVAAGAGCEMGDERRGGRFAVGAGDGDEGRVRRMDAALAAEQLDIADHFDPIAAGEASRPMRRRMGKRHAGRKHQRRDPAPVGGLEVAGRDSGACGMDDAVGVVIPADHFRSPRHERTRRAEPRTAEAEDRDLAPGEESDRDHAGGFLPAPLSLPVFAEGGRAKRGGWDSSDRAPPGPRPRQQSTVPERGEGFR